MIIFAQLIIVRTVPGEMMLTTPPKAQVQVEPETRAGTPPIRVFGASGIHGVVAGTHGMGVSTPRAAAVAAATVGLARLLHIPKVARLTPGALSGMAAAGRPSTMTRRIGSTFRTAGARPKVHWTIAPVTVDWGICLAYFLLPLTDASSSAPLVVTKQMTLRSSSVSQPRAEGSSQVYQRLESR